MNLVLIYALKTFTIPSTIYLIQRVQVHVFFLWSSLVPFGIPQLQLWVLWVIPALAAQVAEVEGEGFSQPHLVNGVVFHLCPRQRVEQNRQ